MIDLDHDLDSISGGAMYDDPFIIPFGCGIPFIAC